MLRVIAAAPANTAPSSWPPTTSRHPVPQTVGPHRDRSGSEVLQACGESICHGQAQNIVSSVAHPSQAPQIPYQRRVLIGEANPEILSSSALLAPIPRKRQNRDPQRPKEGEEQ